MEESYDPVIQTCTACGALIDVTDEEPFATMHCASCGTAQRVRRNFDHFELQEQLGAGGMGAVYRALDTSLNRPVAVKLLHKKYSSDQEFVAQFEKEAAITASINHPNVVKVYTAGQDHGSVYIAMELVDKGSLDDLMTLQGRIAEAQVLEVGIQIAKGLDAALQRGLIHRDVKPGNILFADAHSAKIVDFGLAVLQEHASTVAGEVWGTPYYVAPEKLDNQPEDFRSDIYSLGATLFHAFAGRPPFEAETASMVALKHIKSQAVSLQAFAPDVSSATAYVINKTLEKDPRNRYQSYAEFIEHLEYARNQLLAAPARSPAQKARVVLQDDSTNKAMTLMTFGMIAAIVAGGTYLYMKREAISGTKVPVDPVVEKQRQANASFEPEFQSARALLMKGDFDGSGTAFATLEARPNVPQPLLNWITVHRGLALLLATREPEARPVFEALKARVYSRDPAEQKMADFFTRSAGLLAEPAGVQKTAASEYDKLNHESIALLLFALKNWQMGKFEEANFLFRQFQSSTPEAPHLWIADYKTFATEYTDAYRDFVEVSKQLREAKTDEAKKTAIEAAKQVHTKIRVKGKLAETLEATITQMETELVEKERQREQQIAAEQATDAQALDDLRLKVGPLLAQYKFAEARALAQNVTVVGPKAKRARELAVQRADALMRFKAALIADINASTYAQPIKRKPNTLVLGAAMRANDLNVEVRSPYVNTSLLWTDISPETILNMGRHFLRPTLAPALLAERQWGVGVYAYLANKPAEGRTLLKAAAQGNPAYQETLAFFLEAEAEP